MWVPIIVPIVAIIALGAWLGMIYYADAHPQYRHPVGGQGDLGNELPAGEAHEGATRPEVDVPAPRADAPAPTPAHSVRHAA